MSIEDILKNNADIFEHINDYALIRTSNPERPYRIFHASNYSWVLIEKHSDIVIEKMLSLGVRIVDKEEDVKPPGFKRTYPVWDHEKNQYVILSQEEFDKLLEENRIRREREKEERNRSKTKPPQ
jgi:hypothetical protein